MKNLVSLICLLALLMCGCTHEELIRNDSPTASGRIFSTSFENNESRTYLEDGKYSYWTEGDRISLFDGNTINQPYIFTGETGDDSGTFFTLSKPEGTGMALNTNYAVYPYSKDVKISSNGVITVSLPHEQHYAENSYGLGDNTMVAITENVEDTFLYFKNVGGYIKLQLYGNDVTVKSISLTGNNGEKIAGKATITAVYNEAPVVTMADDATTSITLDCGEKGVKIGATAKRATAFWLVVPPTIFEKGFTIKVKDMDGKVYTQTTDKQLAIKRNVVKPMAAVEATAQSIAIPYLTFTADEAQTLTMSKAVATLEYSLDGINWAELGTKTIAFGGEKGKLRLRGKNLNGTASNDEEYATILFGNAVSVACTGDIRTLVDYENYETANTSSAKFCKLFYECTSLVTAPQLPATNLAEDCYKDMFNNCTSLTVAPELPANDLAVRCYYGMFEGCSSLTNAPKLPAENLAKLCYGAMFYACTNLKTAPELPVTKLADSCYGYMFAFCTNLTTAPKLPATTLTGYCYEGMFYGCTNLTDVPELPATTLASNCYAYMFTQCTSLTQAPELPATTLAGQCYTSMFSECYKLSSAPELPATKLSSYCYAYMFRECTALTSTPILSAGILVNGCYKHMFYGCSKINNVTMLATDISALYCLDNWLYGISPNGTFTKAKTMTSLPSGENGIPSGWTVANNNTTDNIPYITFTADNAQTFTMSKSVSTLEYSLNGDDWVKLGTTTVVFGGDFGELRLRGKNLYGTGDSVIKFGNLEPVACTGDIRTLLDYDNYSTVDTGHAQFKYLFQNCSVLTTAPKLPATELASYCYQNMFTGCKNLIKAPELPATKLEYQCYFYMFDGCTSLQEAPELPATKLDKYCYYYMFRNCTSLTKAPELPAVDLMDDCYGSMFNGCKNLTVAPKLPATELKYNCYHSMFSGCINLTKAPELPATKLAEGCYSSMFINCSSLTTAPELPATKMEDLCYYSMFQNCTNLTTTPQLPATKLKRLCYDSMFKNCTNLTEAPELPATELAGNCYSSMFWGCANLTKAPKLPATELASYCYSYMFAACHKLTNITMLATDISATRCLYCWTSGVAYEGTFTKAKTMTSLPSGINGIPSGWDVKDYEE